MATQDLTQGSGAPAGHLPVRIYSMERVLDFSSAPGAIPGNEAISEVLQLFNVPAKTRVIHVMVETLTAEGGAGTVDIGDGTDPNGFISAHDANAIGNSANSLALTEAAPNTVTGYSNGKYYSAADTIDMVLGAALDAAKLRVVVTMLYAG